MVEVVLRTMTSVMLDGLPVLADTGPTLMQQLIFGGAPGVLWGLLYSTAIAAVVFLPMVSLIAMFGIWWERNVPAKHWDLECMPREAMCLSMRRTRLERWRAPPKTMNVS